MKRCPQCEFLYEDDQSLCDMDGILLVYDSRQFPHLQALTANNNQLPVKSSRKAVPALATVVLASVLGLVYYVSTQRNANQQTYTPATTTTTSNVEVKATESPVTVTDSKVGEDNSNHTNRVTGDAVDESKPNSEKSSSESETTQKKPESKPKAVPTRSSVRPAPQEKESSVGSFFKKTGRILKKPFKF